MKLHCLLFRYSKHNFTEINNWSAKLDSKKLA